MNRSDIGRRVLDELFVLALAGISTGVLVVGVGSRVAMLVLRLTSHPRVVGAQSDDDFTIGRFTLAGTYNLLVIGAIVGIIGAAVYQWVRPWLIGPRWFGYVTVGLASGAVVGSMLVHADGIDFRLLTPTWLAIGLFVALPFLFGVSIGVVVDRLDVPDSVARRGKARWIISGACLLVFPPTIVVLLISSVVLLIWVVARATVADRATTGLPIAVRITIRGLWMGIAVLGLVALVNDIREIVALT